MIRFALLLLCAAAPLHAALYADLSGPWRMAPGDDPRYRQPDFDDRSWTTVSIPIGNRARGIPRNFVVHDEYYWLRRSVDLPSLPNGEPLAITIGAVAEAYELYLDGLLIGATGPFDRALLQVARPRTFSIPPAFHRRTAIIAIRIWNTEVYRWRGLVISDTGPWLITPDSLAPRSAGVAAINQRKSERLADLVQSIVVSSFSLIVLWIWTYERSRREILWLGLYLLLIGSSRLDAYLLLDPDGYPFVYDRWIHGIIMAILPAVLLAQFIASSLGPRWFLWPVRLIAATGAAGILFHPLASAWALWAIDLLVLIGLALACLSRFRTGPWQGPSRFLLAAVLALVIYSHASGWARLDLLGLPPLSLLEGPFLFSAHVMSVTCLAFGFSVILVRRLLRDRDEKVRLTAELEAARTVQQMLLPAAHRLTTAYESHAIYSPAQEVGGDFYWSRIAADGSLIVVLGDVSGKGLQAAMLVSVVVGVLRNERADSPATILSALNEALVGHTAGGFVTCCCGRFRPDGSLTFANAGHLAPYCNGSEVAFEFDLPLGVASGLSYLESELHLEPGGRITLISDGVIEAANSKGELFGFSRMADIATRPAEEIAGAARAWGQNDDITVLTVRRLLPA